MRQARGLDAERWAARGDVAAARSAAAEARAAWERALALDPVHPGAAEGLARLDERAGGLEGALALRTRVAAAAERERWPLPSRAAALRNAALTALRAKQLDAAAAALERQRALGASTLETDLTLAAVQLARGELDAAARSRALLAARYGAVEPAFRLALTVAAQAQSPAALDELLVFLLLRRSSDAVEPGEPASGSAVSRALAAQQATRRGDVEAARRLWADLRHGPLATLAALETAKLDLAAARPAAALDALAACRSDARLPCESRFFQEARALQALQRLDAARAAAQAAVACNPLAARSLALLGAIESERGDAAAAERAQRAARELETSLAAQSSGPEPAR